MLDLQTTQEQKIAYLTQKTQLSDLIQYIKIFNNDAHAQIKIASATHIQAQIDASKDQSAQDLPLYDIPFGVKENIDVAIFYTTKIK